MARLLSRGQVDKRGNLPALLSPMVQHAISEVVSAQGCSCEHVDGLYNYLYVICLVVDLGLLGVQRDCLV